PPLTGPRVLLAGVLLGLAISVKSWPVLLAPALLIGLPDWRTRGLLVIGAGAVLLSLFATLPITVGTPGDQLGTVAGKMLGYSPMVGSWGWPAVLIAFRPPAPSVWEDPFYLEVRSVGKFITLLGVAAAIWWWRRADMRDIAGVSASAFQVVT